MDQDVLICFGGEVKALDGGRVEGYLVRFSSTQDPDITQTKDFFTPGTDFDLERSTKSTIYFDHGLDGVIKRRKLGQGEMKVDEVGVWISGVLNRRDRYENAIYEMARAGKLGWSSGTAVHLAEREKVGDAHKIVRWPLGLDASLTPTPAEPRNNAVASLKSYMETRIEVKFVGDEILIDQQPSEPATKCHETQSDEGKAVAEAEAVAEAKGEEEKAVAIAEAVAEAKIDSPSDGEKAAEVKTPTAAAQIKGIFDSTLEEYLDEQQTPWMFVSAFEQAFRKICEAAEAAELLASTLDFNGLIDEAVNEFAARLRAWGRTELSKMREMGMSMNGMSPSYLSLRSPLKDLVEMKARPQAGVPSEYHSEVVLAAIEEFSVEALTLVPELKAWVERRKKIAELRASKLPEAEAMKVGRVISSATANRMSKLRKKIAAAMTEMQTMDTELDELMSLAKPKEETASKAVDLTSEVPASLEVPTEETKSAETPDDLQLAAAFQMELLRFNSLTAVGAR